jgi:hypothetical protein
MESQSDCSDSGTSLGTDTHSSFGHDGDSNSQCEEDGEGQDDEESQDKNDREDQGGTGEKIADDKYAAQRSFSIGTHRNPAEKFRNRYPSRKCKQPSRFCANTATRATCHDKVDKNALNNLRSLQQCHTSQPVDTDTPSLKVAPNSTSHDLWEAAIHEEHESLREAQTWDEVKAPKGAKVFPFKFVLKIRRHSDEAVERHEALLVLGTCSVLTLTITTHTRQEPILPLCASCLLSL